MSSVVLRIQYANGQVESLPLEFRVYEIGRTSGDILLSDPDTSSRHARLEVTSAGAFVTDLASTNGTWDGHGRRLGGRHPILNNEAIRLGTTLLTVLAAAPVPGGTRVMPAYAAGPPPSAALPPAPGAVPNVAAARVGNRGPVVERFSAGGKSHQVKWFSGVLLDTRRESTVHVSSSGWGSAAGVTSTTSILDELCVRDSHGREQSFQLPECRVAARVGSEVTVLWAIADGHDRGPYIAVRNHTTRTTYFSDQALKRVFMPFVGTPLYEISTFILAMVTCLAIVPVIFLYTKGKTKEIEAFKARFTFAD